MKKNREKKRKEKDNEMLSVEMKSKHIWMR